MTAEYRFARVGAGAASAWTPADDYPLDATQQMRIGREGHNEIRIVGDTQVSRDHALLTIGDDGGWYVFDLHSRNGTYVNDAQITIGTKLKPGDVVRFGPNGPEFRFERIPVAVPAAPLPPAAPPIATPPPTSPPAAKPARAPVRIGGIVAAAQDPPTSDGWSDVIPVLSGGRIKPLPRAYLVRGGLLVPAMIVLVLLNGGHDSAVHEGNVALSRWLATAFDLTLVLFFVTATCAELLHMAGRPKPWYALAGAAATTAVVLTLTATLTVIVGGWERGSGAAHVMASFEITHTFVVCAFQELVKALPILLAVWIGHSAPQIWRSRLGVCDPLDGIVIGAGSAAGFEIVEVFRKTLGPDFAAALAVVGAGVPAVELAQTSALMALLPQVIGDIFGDIAYSGYFGYVIGVAVLKPEQRWKLFFSGWAIATLAHAVWDISSTITDPVAAAVLELIVGLGSFRLLVGSIGRARRYVGMTSQARSVVAGGQGPR